MNAAVTAWPRSSASDWLERFREQNPFESTRVTRQGEASVDVPTIHAEQFQRLLDMLRRVQRGPHSIGVAVWGDAGSGKSNLLGRLARWADNGSRAVFVQPQSLHVPPHRLAQSIWCDVVATLLNPIDQPIHQSPLYRALEAFLLQESAPCPGGLADLRLQATLNAFLRRFARSPHPVNEAVARVLLRFFRSAYYARLNRPCDPVLSRAIRWLSGEALESSDRACLDLRGDWSLTDPSAMTHAFAIVSRVLATIRVPLIVVFDQIQSLDETQVASLMRLLHEWLDTLGNLLVVVSEVQQTMADYLHRRVIARAAWDRVAEFTIAMNGLSPSQARQLLETRLSRGLTPWEDVPEVADRMKNDRLFPLGSDWFSAWVGDRAEVLPRRLLQAARDRWDDQTSRPQSPSMNRSEQIDAVVDRAVQARLDEFRANPSRLPPNAENLIGLAEAVLQWLRHRGQPALITITPGTEPASLVAAYADGTFGGLTALTTGNATSATAVLRRLAENEAGLERLWLVTEDRQPLALGQQSDARGREFYRELMSRSAFRHVTLTAEQYAQLEAFHQVMRSASDLETRRTVEPPEALTANDVADSLWRCGWLQRHPLLREVARLET